MLGYDEDDLNNMIYAVQSADILIDTDKNPDIHHYLLVVDSFLQGLFAEGYFN